AGTWENLTELLLSNALDVTPFVEQYRPGTCRSLVERDNIIHSRWRSENEHIKTGSHGRTRKRTCDGYPGIGPVGRSLSADRQYSVSNARAQVACRIYRKTSSSSKSDTDDGDKCSDNQRIETFRKAVRSYKKYAHNEDHGSDNFADEVVPRRSDGGTSAKNCELQCRVRCSRPMR